MNEKLKQCPMCTCLDCLELEENLRLQQFKVNCIRCNITYLLPFTSFSHLQLRQAFASCWPPDGKEYLDYKEN